MQVREQQIIWWENDTQVLLEKKTFLARSGYELVTTLWLLQSPVYANWDMQPVVGGDPYIDTGYVLGMGFVFGGGGEGEGRKLKFTHFNKLKLEPYCAKLA